MSESSETGIKRPRPEDENAFKQWVKEYVSVDDNISLVYDRAKQWKDKKKDLDARIKEYMSSNDILGCNLADGALVLKATKKKPALTKRLLEEKITNVITNETVRTTLLESIFSEEDTTTKYSLKRIKEEKKTGGTQIDISES